MAASQPQTPEFIVSDREQITGARRPSASDSAKTLDQEETGQVLHQEETDLISPEEMDINETASSVAQPVLTPLGKRIALILLMYWQALRTFCITNELLFIQKGSYIS
ncbi:hypothetical protein KUTeg_005941 [Tegillarca granosa]|uniref:Uncharacterized protein n=1 Tax=Tegillarca granosa TaxID=220873 RepID=A0ABQ9FJ22_TEGGR|nr:hypothetical protein KUTeg_005941 [Tegillarca granosa]